MYTLHKEKTQILLSLFEGFSHTHPLGFGVFFFVMWWTVRVGLNVTGAETVQDVRLGIQPMQEGGQGELQHPVEPSAFICLGCQTRLSPKVLALVFFFKALPLSLRIIIIHTCWRIKLNLLTKWSSLVLHIYTYETTYLHYHEYFFLSGASLDQDPA